MKRGAECSARCSKSFVDGSAFCKQQTVANALSISNATSLLRCIGCCTVVERVSRVQEADQPKEIFQHFRLLFRWNSQVVAH
jgi:hypothetical protein